MSARSSRYGGLVLVAVLLAGLLALAVGLAACGDSGDDSGDTSASPEAAASPDAASIAEYTAYYQAVKPVYEQIAAAMATLDGSVANLSETPDKTWTKSAEQMSAASAEFGDAADALEQITPPEALADAQMKVTAALQGAQDKLDEIALYLDQRVADPEMPDIKTTVEQEVKATLTAELQAAVTQVMEGLGAGASPSATP